MNKEISFILHPQRWDVLQSITRGYLSATTISQHLGVSLAYINQQLTLLEAAGFVKRSKKMHHKVGKPQAEFSIAKEVTWSAYLRKDTLFASSARISPHTNFLLNTRGIHDESDRYFVQKFYYANDDLFHEAHSMGLLGINKLGIDILFITDDVDELRKNRSAIVLKNASGDKRTIAIWSHTLREVQEGLERHEPYFVDKIRGVQPLWDGDGHSNLDKLKKKLISEVSAHGK